MTILQFKKKDKNKAILENLKPLAISGKCKKCKKKYIYKKLYLDNDGIYLCKNCIKESCDD